MHPQAYITYLFHFHCTRDFFECHEVLEEHWNSINRMESIWVGLIQVAVAMYHYRRNNRNGALRMLHTAIKNIRKHPVQTLDLDQDRLLSQLNELYNRCDQQQPYIDIDLPITNQELMEKCKRMAERAGYIWGSPSNMEDVFLIEKHRLRDRSEIIEERQRQLEDKNRGHFKKGN